MVNFQELSTGSKAEEFWREKKYQSGNFTVKAHINKSTDQIYLPKISSELHSVGSCTEL